MANMHRVNFRIYAAIFTIASMVSGCTSLIYSEKLSNVDIFSRNPQPSRILFFFYGHIPGISMSALADVHNSIHSSKALPLSDHIVYRNNLVVLFFINSTQLPAAGELCGDHVDFNDFWQTGHVTAVVAVLCDGKTVLSKASGTALLVGEPLTEVNARLDRFQSELFEALRDVPDHENGSR